MNTILVALHVVAAVFIIGPMAILPQTALRAVRAKQGGTVEVLARSTAIFSLISLLVALLGFGALATADKKYHLKITTPWVLISLILYILAFALSMLAVVPALRSAGERLLALPTTAGSSGSSAAVAGSSATAAGELPESDYRRIAMASGVVTLLLLVVVVLMAWRP